MKIIIDIKFLKHDTNDCFEIHIPRMNKFDPNKLKFVYVGDKEADKCYEYFMFAAGFENINCFVIIDIINKKLSISKIEGMHRIDDIAVTISSINPPVVNVLVNYYDTYGTFTCLLTDEKIENFLSIFEFKSRKFSKYPRSSVAYLDESSKSIMEYGFKNPNKDLDHNKIRKEENTMATTKKNENKIATPEVNTEPAKKEEPTPREIISQYAEAYDNMTKDAIRGNEVFGLLAPEHRLAIAAHLDQIVEILESYIK